MLLSFTNHLVQSTGKQSVSVFSDFAPLAPRSIIWSLCWLSVPIWLIDLSNLPRSGVHLCLSLLFCCLLLLF